MVFKRYFASVSNLVGGSISTSIFIFSSPEPGILFKYCSGASTVKRFLMVPAFIKDSIFVPVLLFL